MCGIVGAIGKELDAKWLRALIEATAPRGKEATGFWTPTTDIVKAPKIAEDFFKDTKTLKKFNKGVKESNILLGHCRYSTHGKPEFNYNNHPIESENWIIVHNGVVYIKDFDDYEYQTDTDTENILAYIERYGLEQGLSYIKSGAAVILKDKREDNAIYVWKSHSAADMLLFLDETRSTIYVCSGDKYLNVSVKDMWEDIDGYEGLFSKLPFPVRTAEPQARELWKFTYAEEQVSAKCVAKIEEHTNAVRGGDWEQGQLPSIDVGYGKLRPGVLEGRVKKPEPYVYQRNYPGTTPLSLVKNGNRATPSGIFMYDIVELKRDITVSDAVYSTDGEMPEGLHKGKHFEVKKILRNSRYAIADQMGRMYVVEEDLIRPATSPSCMGVAPGHNVDKCGDCYFNRACEKMFNDYEEAYSEEEMPECVGTFDSNDDCCQECEFIAYCINHSVFVMDSNIVDAEYTEVSREYVQE